MRTISKHKDLLAGSIYCIEYKNAYSQFSGHCEFALLDLKTNSWIEYEKHENMFLHVESRIEKTYGYKTCLLYWISRNQQVEIYEDHILGRKTCEINNK